MSLSSERAASTRLCLVACTIVAGAVRHKRAKTELPCCNEPLLPVVLIPPLNRTWLCLPPPPSLPFRQEWTRARHLTMASGDRSSFLEIPGAWISKEWDLDLSFSASLTPPSSKEPAYISTSLKESPTPPPRRDLLPPPVVPIVVHSTPRASYPTLGLRKSNPRGRKAIFVMPVDLKAAAETTPQVRSIQSVCRFL